MPFLFFIIAINFSNISSLACPESSSQIRDHFKWVSYYAMALKTPRQGSWMTVIYKFTSEGCCEYSGLAYVFDNSLFGLILTLFVFAVISQSVQVRLDRRMLGCKHNITTELVLTKLFTAKKNNTEGRTYYHRHNLWTNY